MADWNKYWTGLKKGLKWTWSFLFDDFKKQVTNSFWVGTLAFFLIGIYMQLYRMLGLSAIVAVAFFFLTKIAKEMKG
jgi:hypothetical protein